MLHLQYLKDLASYQKLLMPRLKMEHQIITLMFLIEHLSMFGGQTTLMLEQTGEAKRKIQHLFLLRNQLQLP
jgi:hypothetical protein